MVLEVTWEIKELPAIFNIGHRRSKKVDSLEKAAAEYKDALEQGYVTEKLVDTGQLISGIEITLFDDAVTISNVTRYAAAIELGSFAYSAPPPIKPLAEWIQRQHGLTGAALWKAARGLQRHIYLVGTRMRPVWQRVLDDDTLVDKISEQIATEFSE